MSIIRSVCIFVVTAVFSFACWSEVMTDLYDDKVLVSDQSEEKRKDALQEALLKVIIKVSGQSQAGGNSIVQKALPNSVSYLQEFGYSASDEVLEVELDGQIIMQPLVQLDVGFSQKAVSDLLRRAGLPIWSNNRPSVLVWLVVDNGKKRRLLNQMDIEKQEILIEEMNRRGLPSILPLLDLQDQMEIDTKKIWSLDYQRILKASSRYGSDSVLVGRVNKTASGQWRGSWHYLFKGQKFLIESNAKNLSVFMDEGIDGVVSFLSQRYAIDTLAAGGEMYLDVRGVGLFSDYVRVTQYLESLEPVRSVAVERVDNEKVNYRLTFEGEIRLVQEIIELGGIITAVDNIVSENVISKKPVDESVRSDVGESKELQQQYHYRISQH